MVNYTAIFRAGCNSLPAVSFLSENKPASAFLLCVIFEISKKGQQIWCDSKADGIVRMKEEDRPILQVIQQDRAELRPKILFYNYLDGVTMFGGLVETTGEITHIEASQGSKTFTITPATPFNDIALGDSIAVNGVCLTVTQFSSDSFVVTAVPETLRLTNLDELNVHQTVNLERSLKADARVGGHYVQGHVDTTGHVIELTHDNHSNALIVKIGIEQQWSKYMVNKGYITLDGMSITIIESAPTWFTITLIPHTLAVTIAKNYRIGSRINIEVDILGKYVEKLIGAQTNVIPH